MKTLKLLSKYSFAPPRFLSGLSSTLDLGATTARYHNYLGGTAPQVSDFMATQSDWMITGEDMSCAIVSFQKEANTGW